MDGAPSALSNGKHTQLPSWCSDKTMANCQLSQSGMTFKPLTEDHGEDVLTSFLEAFPAKTLAAPAKAKASKETDHPCGNTWRESLEKFDLDTHTWKTHQCLWDEDLQPSSVILPKWGMMLDGVLWERTTLPRLTSGTGYGSWPTPKSSEPGMSAKTSGRAVEKSTHLTTQVALAEGMINPKTGNMWPTPRCFMHKDAAYDRGKANLGEVVCGQEGATIENPINGQLNPTWVEWLMGWPIGWTSMDTIEDLDWRDWETDPADELPPEEWRSPAASEPGITAEKLRPIDGGELGGMNRHFDKDTGRMAQIGITQQVKIRDKGGTGSIPRVATGIKHRVGRLKAIGNGQVPQVAAMAWNILNK